MEEDLVGFICKSHLKHLTYALSSVDMYRRATSKAPQHWVSRLGFATRMATWRCCSPMMYLRMRALTTMYSGTRGRRI